MATVIFDSGKTTQTGSTTSTDTLVFNTTAADLSSNTLISLEILKAGITTDATVFTVDQDDLAAKGQVLGTKNFNDVLEANETVLDLSSTTLSSVEILRAGTSFATTFTVDQADLAKGGTIKGSTSTGDELVAHGVTLDLTSTTLSGIETLVAGNAKATTFTLDAADFTGLTGMSGNSGGGTLILKGAVVDLSGVSLSHIETLKIVATADTTFTVKDLTDVKSIIGTAKSDLLILERTNIDLSKIALSSIEHLQAGLTSSTTFTLDQADLAKNGSVTGSASGLATDTIVAAGTALDLSSTTYSDIEILKAGTTNDTTFTLQSTLLNALDEIDGNGGNDTLIVKAKDVAVDGIVLDSLETIKAANAAGATFTLKDSQLASNGGDVAHLVGAGGIDTLHIIGNDFDLSKVTLSGVEKLVGDAAAVLFTLDQADLAKGGTVAGITNGVDTITTNGTGLDLTSTTLTSIEELATANTDGTTFVLTEAEFGQLGVTGGSGDDTLVVKTTDFDVAGASVSSVEILKAGLAKATTFTVNATDLPVGGGPLKQIIGSAGKDTLIVNSTSFDLTFVALSSIEVLQAGSTDVTTFKLQQDDLAAKGSIVGSTSTGDTVLVDGVTLDLSSTTLTSIENLTFSKNGGTLIVTTAQFNAETIAGTKSSTDELRFAATSVDLTNATLTGIDTIGAGLSKATTFKLDLADVTGVDSIVGDKGVDTLIIKGADFDLSSTAASSIEKLVADSANGTAGTVFTVDQADLAGNGSVIGGKGTDILKAAGDTLDLSGTVLTSIEQLQAGTTLATTFIVDQADLAKNGSVLGTGKDDTLESVGTSLDLTSTVLSSIEILQAGSSKSIFTVDTADLASGGSVIGSTNVGDTLIVKDTAFDLTSTALTSIEILKAGVADTTFILDQADLTGLGTIVGSSGKEGIQGSGTTIDLTSITLSSVERLQASVEDTTFTVDQADLLPGGSVFANSTNTSIDTLEIKGTSLNLTSTTLSGVEILKAHLSTATTFTVDAGDLAAGGSVVGSTSNDTLIVKSTAFDLTSTSLSSIEILQAGLATATTFTVNAADLASGGSVIGGKGIDTLSINGPTWDLTDTTISSIEKLVAENATNSQIILQLDDTDIAALGSAGTITLIGGSTINGIEVVTGDMDLTHVTIGGNIEQLIDVNSGSVILLDQADIVALGTGGGVSGSSSTLVIHGTLMDLSSTTITGVEALGTDSSKGTTFIVDKADIAAMGASSEVNGGKGIDTLVINGNITNLTSPALNSIEKLVIASTANSQIILHLDDSDIAAMGDAGTISITGGNAINSIEVETGNMDLTHVAISGVGQLIDTNTGSSFLVDQADIAALGNGGGISGSSSSIVIHGTLMDLSSTTLSSIKTITTDSAKGTTFILDQGDLANNGSVIGNTSANDTLVAHESSVDLTSSTLTSVEVLKAGSSLSTNFTLDQTDIDGLTSVVGGTSTGDTLVAVNATGNTLDISNLKLTSIETIQTKTKDGEVDLTVGAQGGVTLELGAANGTDTIIFTDAYKATTVTSDPTILAHTLTIENFIDGASSGDVLDLGGLLNGNVTASSNVDVTGAANLKAALNVAAAGDGSATSKVITFDFGGDTYVLVDNSAGKAITADDAVIKLVGSHTLVDADNFIF